MCVSAGHADDGVEEQEADDAGHDVVAGLRGLQD